MLYENVKAYINEFVLHSDAFDSATTDKQRKAINNAEAVLLSIYKRYGKHNPLPVEAVAYQAIYMLTKDDSALRADKGASSISFNGVAMSFAQVNRTVAPDVVRILGRRVGSYSVNVSDTNRGVMNDTNE